VKHVAGGKSTNGKEVKVKNKRRDSRVSMGKAYQIKGVHGKREPGKKGVVSKDPGVKRSGRGSGRKTGVYKKKEKKFRGKPGSP